MTIGNAEKLRRANQKIVCLKRELKFKDTEINKLHRAIDRMAEIIEECRQNDCLYSDDIDLSQIAGTKAIKEYFMEDKE